MNCDCCITYNAPDLMDGGVTAARIEEEATDPTPLQERIERILAEHQILPPTYAGDDPIARKRKRTAARIAEEVAAEVRKARHAAWVEGAATLDESGYYSHAQLEAFSPYREQED